MQSHDLNTLSRRAASIQLRGSLEAAATIYQHVAAMRPRDFHALSQLAFVNDELGNVEAAISGYRRAVELRPDNAAAHSNLCLALNYDEQFTAQLIFDEHLGWARRHGAQLASLPRASVDSSRPRYDLSGERCRLRVGYISADFREHPRTRFLLPVLAAHDHRAVETY